ncbi:Nose resistant to fluoxetine protein 6 [Habropoda laboriosa]|uniref:Nose resistant to fluoxetine protein 6 n=1 Tax=Habropoda laboriosa TaxID=597456 RepID=A0A0L7RK54_9HYME|nr:Nose resistant to fluoxetine protein 6 [Habropoda laboriosa]
MAAALLGKCIGLLALVLLLYTSCYAFRIRDHPGQSPSSAEQTHRAACTSIFGRCQEKTTAATSISRKWHDTPTQRLASNIRKPPVELTSADDDDRRRRESAGSAKSVEIDEDEDEEEVIVEVEEDTEEEIKSDDLVEEDSGEEDDQEDDEDEDEDDENDDDDDDDDDEKEESKVDEGGDEDEEEEAQKKKDLHGKMSKITKTVRKKDVEDTEEDDEESGRVASKKKVVLEKILKKTDEEEEDEEEKSEEIDSKKKVSLEKKVDKEEDDDDEDDEDEEESEEEVSTPPPRKLEKVRLADKDKVRSTEAVPVTVKPKLEVKEPPKTIKKPEEPVKKIVETPKKPVESPAKSSEATKKDEPVKITKSESESAKPKATVKPEVPKIRESVKQPEKAKVKPSETAQAVPAKVAELKRSDKDESKGRTKKHVEASFTLAQLNDAILHVPTFVPNFTAVEDFECQQHGKIFLRQLRGYKLWALQMLDSSAKIPSGLLRGNVNQLGDFDECLGVVAHVKLNDNTIKVQGKYCLANIDVYPSHPDMKLPVNMMQARAFIRGSMRDPGHFVPRFTTVNWALCLPAACSAEDAQNVVEQALSEYNSTAGIKFTVDVDPNMCYVKQKTRSYSKETVGVLYFYAMIVCIATVATVRDYLVASEGKGNYSERIIMSFSLRRTVRSLLKKGSNEADITCIHGIRALVTIALYVAHQIIPISRLPFSNRIELTEVANTPISSILRVSMVYTDAFLLLSGVLTAYNMAHEFIMRGEIRWFCRFIARYIRLTPALFAVVFWYAFVMEHTGWGPQWNSVITPNAELCKSNAWTNLLYIQNFFPFEEMCAAHTHQLALDMQLSLLTPMLVFFLECRPVIGILAMFFFILLSATLRYISTMNNYLSLVIFHGMSSKHLYRTANLSYILPLHRATPYVFGVGLGVLLRYTGRNVRIHKVLVILGWLIAMALGSWSLFSPWHLARRDYVYDAEEATNYAVISPVLWALALCWSIFACYTNHGGIINKVLSSHWLIIFSRISYAVYLTQFAVFFYNVGTTRYSAGFQVLRLIDPMEAAAVVIVSTILTLLFDFPMQELKNVLMESTDMLNVEVPNKEISSKQVSNEIEKSSTSEQPAEGKVFEEDEVSSTGWDWQRDIVDGGTKYPHHDVEDEEHVQIPILKKTTGRRKSFIGHDSIETETVPLRERTKDKRYSRDDDEYRERGRRSRSGQRDYQESENDGLDLSRMQQERDRRSLSRSHDVKRLGPEPKRLSSKSEERESTQRQTRPALSRSGDSRRAFSSESEDEHSLQRRKMEKKQPSVETRISDEEDWENELRIRRKEFMEKLETEQEDSFANEKEEEDLSSLRRRSSAEGKIALLKDPSADDNMDSWTVSVGSRIGSKRISVQDLSTLSQEDLADLSTLSDLADSGWNVVRKEGEGLPRSPPTGLYKRESIIKSQASEEDPEYLLPERPKLIQQEREHPFKKAWQMQKSRSEEDRTSAYVIQELQGEPRKESEDRETKDKDVPTEEKHQKESGGEQYEDMGAFADDESESIRFARSRSSDTEDNTRTSSKSEEIESMERSESTDLDVPKTNTKSSDVEDDSFRSNWPSEEEQLEVYRTGLRSKSEEAEWSWEREET